MTGEEELVWSACMRCMVMAEGYLVLYWLCSCCSAKKTGEVLPCAAEKYALIEAAEERQKSEASVNGEDGIRSLEDFEKDPVAEAFQDDKKRSDCRAISSTSNVKHHKMAITHIRIS